MKTLEDYNLKLKELENEFALKKSNLAKKFVFSNAEYGIVDIISDNIDAIIIERLQCSVTYGIPNVVYVGVHLKKDLTPRKDGSRVGIFKSHCSEIKLIKKAI